jgi:hypothetical protein
VLQRFNLLNVKAPPTPLPEGYQPKPNIGTADPELRSKFQQVIGSLLYIMIGTQLSRTRSFIRFSELESLSLDMIRWLVT